MTIQRSVTGWDYFGGESWWGHQDLNLGPTDYEIQQNERTQKYTIINYIKNNGLGFSRVVDYGHDLLFVTSYSPIIPPRDENALIQVIELRQSYKSEV